MSKWNRSVKDTTTDAIDLIRDSDYAYRAPLVREQYDPSRGSSREYVWTDDAACNGVYPELFQVSQVGDPGLEGISTHDLQALNQGKVKRAKEYCEGCPVRATCIKMAEPQDLYWSVRGGRTPLKLVPLEGGGARRPPVFNADSYLD